MEITTNQIKDLRDKTGVSVMQCKKALEEAGGDMEKAIMVLQKNSKATALKKTERTLGSGVVQAYLHSTGSVGVLVELMCETDFVAKNEDFKKLAYDIAMHIAAADPQYLSKEDIGADAIKSAEEIFAQDIEGKPEELKSKIMEGKLASYFGERTLLDQPYVKNPDITIRGLIEGAVQKFGEKTEIGRFARFSTKK
ncbi:MAG: elongation factor Ts [Candidatus Paceibacterota bacterium]